MNPPSWSQYISLLSLFAATAAYVSAIRLWFHKVRTDALDALRKAKDTPDEAKLSHLKTRMSNAVAILRLIAVIDVGVLTATGFLFRHAFREWLPSRCWSIDRSFDEFGLAIQFMWVVFGLFCFAHMTSAVHAFTLRAKYDSAVGERATRKRIEGWEKAFYGILFAFIMGIVILVA